MASHFPDGDALDIALHQLSGLVSTLVCACQQLGFVVFACTYDGDTGKFTAHTDVHLHWIVGPAVHGIRAHRIYFFGVTAGV